MKANLVRITTNIIFVISISLGYISIISIRFFNILQIRFKVTKNHKRRWWLFFFIYIYLFIVIITILNITISFLVFRQLNTLFAFNIYANLSVVFQYFFTAKALQPVHTKIRFSFMLFLLYINLLLKSSKTY